MLWKWSLNWLDYLKYNSNVDWWHEWLPQRSDDFHGLSAPFMDKE